MRRKHFIFGLIICLAAVALATPGAPSPVKPGSAARNYWAYQPIKHQQPPAVHDSAWPRNDIDRFILAKLESRGLHPAPDADAATLLRRVYFDLIGLPPTPEQIDAFIKDAAPDRYERVVDRLLASPQFGQRWGRHWLDVARFGESLTLRGFLLKDAWRYRDYVIDAFNRDRPYDRFMTEQIAGDLLPAASMEDRQRQLVATLFLTLGNVNLEEQDKKQLEMDVVDEQINALGTAFLAQTIGWARCHDHKFDPIPTHDYYALAGILHSTESLEHANVSKHLEIPLPVDPGREEVLKEQEAAVAALREQIAQAKGALAKGNGGSGLPHQKGAIAIADLPGIVVDDTQARQVGYWKVSTTAKPFIGSGYLTDNNDHKESKSLTFHPDFPEPGKYEVRFAYTYGGNRASNATVTVFSADGEQKIIVDERKRPPVDGHFISLGQHTFEKNGQGFVVVSNDGADNFVTADAVQFIPAELVAATHTSTAVPSSVQAPTDGSQKSEVKSEKSDSSVSATADSVKKMEAQLKKLMDTGPKRDAIESVREAKKIADVPIHMRGNVHTLGEMVPRGFLQVIAMDHRPAVPQNQSGRRELGEWLANPQNPLPARVMANRAWHWLLGAGIVRTVDNFGTTGELPSHPELLDYLAGRFVAEHWSVKSLVRQIVLSHAYQQSTADDATALAADPENRLCWRMNRRRLDAECIRDSVLSVSGQMTPCAGGPTYDASLKSDFAFRQTATFPSVYLPAFRNAMPEIFEAFDIADPSVSTGRRNVSTVAPQALFMLNSPFVIDQARHAASRLLGEKELMTDDARIGRAYELALGRVPTEAERRMMIGFLTQSSSGDAPMAAQDAWAQVFHALFASTDFRYVK